MKKLFLIFMLFLLSNIILSNGVWIFDDWLNACDLISHQGKVKILTIHNDNFDGYPLNAF